MVSVWIIAKGYAPDEGGLETYARAIANAYQGLGLNVTVFTQTSVGPRTLLDQGVALIDVGPGSQLAIMLRLIRALQMERRRQGAPDLIHSVTWRTSLPAILLGVGPIIISVHGREINFAWGLLACAMKAALKRAAAILTVSSATRDRLLLKVPTLNPVKVHVAWNGLSSWASYREKKKHESGESLRLLSVCRLVPRKNIIGALRAAARARSEGLSFSYDIGGRGPDLEQLKEIVSGEGLGADVRLLGYVPDERVRQLYAEADVFIHPQVEDACGKDFEGFGIAVADAMAAGAACVVGVAGGPSELIQDGVTGIVVDGNDSEAVFRALAYLLTNPDETYVIGQRAREFARTHFSWTLHVQRALAAVNLDLSGPAPTHGLGCPPS